MGRSARHVARAPVMDAGRVLQDGTPAQIHTSLRNARVADLVGIQNRFQGVWLGPAESPGQGRLRWTGGAAEDPGAPVLTVRDKRKLPAGHAVTWVVPNDGILLIEPGADNVRGAGDFDAEVTEARHLGEITLATLRVPAVPGAHLVLTLAGAQRQALAPGAHLRARLDPGRVHVMPLRTGPGAPPAAA